VSHSRSLSQVNKREELCGPGAFLLPHIILLPGVGWRDLRHARYLVQICDTLGVIRFSGSRSNMISLREYSQTDLERLVTLANNQSVSRYLVSTFPYPYTRADAEWWIASGSKQNGAITRVIENDGLFVGSVGITPQSGWRDHVAEIGYWVAEEHWGKGIATMALRQMTDYGFSQRNLRKLSAPVLAPNVASMKVLEKCGYQREGILKNEVQKGGTYFDTHHFARHRPEI
jgi:[ribosomal protein S5]-alanine N-acetyltransferase